MAFSLPLPPPLPARGWKVKIRDKERSEPPHVTILHKTRAWRLSLRGDGFLDRDPPPTDIPGEVLEELEKHFDVLREKWDEMYPENPVHSMEDCDE